MPWKGKDGNVRGREIRNGRWWRVEERERSMTGIGKEGIEGQNDNKGNVKSRKLKDGRARERGSEYEKKKNKIEEG